LRPGQELKRLAAADVENVERLARWLGVYMGDKKKFGRVEWRLELAGRVYHVICQLRWLDNMRKERG